MRVRALLVPVLMLAVLLPVCGHAQTLAEQVLALTNIERWEHGQLPPLKGNAQLASAAQSHSTNMATRDFFMHCDPDTRLGFAYRVGHTGYSPALATENLALGSSTAAAVMTLWMTGAESRFNILADYRELGVGYQADPNDFGPKRSTGSGASCIADRSLNGHYGHYWNQVFGLRYGSYPMVIAREAAQTDACTVDLYVYAEDSTQEMRFSNDGGANWSPWQPYDENAQWTLNGDAGGTATVHSQIRSDSGSVLDAADSIRLNLACGSVALSRVFLNGFD